MHVLFAKYSGISKVNVTKGAKAHPKSTIMMKGEVHPKRGLHVTIFVNKK